MTRAAAVAGRIAAWLLAGAVLAGCAAAPARQTPLRVGDGVVAIPGISACSDSPAATSIDPSRPLTLIVHGCFSSAGRFAALAEVFRFHGQQALCFNYDDRDSLTHSAGRLAQAVSALQREAGVGELTLIGHSQGGLIARRALTGDGAATPGVTLVTISAPFGGIRAAAHCGSKTLAWLSLGLTRPICHIATGAKWSEIPPSAVFIREPGRLNGAVRRHLKIVTDERGSCRRAAADGGCLESDHVFSTDEQYQSGVDAFAGLDNVEIRAGHVEIVGDARVAPLKLIGLLQAQGILATTPSGRASAWRLHLSRLYDLPGRAIPGAD